MVDKQYLLGTNDAEMAPALLAQADPGRDGRAALWTSDLVVKCAHFIPSDALCVGTEIYEDRIRTSRRSVLSCARRSTTTRSTEHP